MTQYWRVAGMSYLRYANVCAEMVRKAIKPDVKNGMRKAAPYTMIKSDWENGKVVKRVTIGVVKE